MRNGLPAPYILVMGFLALLGVLVALVSFGVPPFDNLATFIVTSSITVLVYMVFGILGGLFVGMVLAHRVLENRSFTPFEREVLQSLAEIRERLDAIEGRKPADPPEMPPQQR